MRRYLTLALAGAAALASVAVAAQAALCGAVAVEPCEGAGPCEPATVCVAAVDPVLIPLLAAAGAGLFFAWRGGRAPLLALGALVAAAGALYLLGFGLYVIGAGLLLVGAGAAAPSRGPRDRAVAVSTAVSFAFVAAAAVAVVNGAPPLVVDLSVLGAILAAPAGFLARPASP